MTAPVYRPILLTRDGELQAVSELAQQVRGAFTPIFAVHPATTLSLEDHVEAVAEKVARRLPGPTVALDTAFVDEEHDVATSHPLIRASMKVEATMGLALIPVVSRSAGSSQTATAAEVHRRHGAGACVRLPLHDRTALVEAADRLDQVVDALGVPPADVDIVLDAADVEVDREYATALVAAAMQPEPNGTTWRSVTLCASSFPRGVASFRSHGGSRVARRDWRLWNDTADDASIAGSGVPDYGDYGISDPEPPDAGHPKFTSISTHLRYSADDDWLIAKGDVFNDGRGEASAKVLEVARMIAEHPEFKGAGFSAGDHWIAEVASRRRTDTGSATTWRQAGTNHHITLVTRALASLDGS